MFDMIGAAPICVRADREVQDSICERLTLPDNLCRTSGTDRGGRQDFCSDSQEGKIRAKNPVV